MRTADTSLFEQLPLGEMEFGLAQPIAVARLEPAEFEKKLGLTFEPARDDLDELVTALIRGASGRQFALVRHLHQPKPGTTILTNEKSCDFARDLQESLAALQMNIDGLDWIHPDAVEAPARGASLQ